MAIKREGIPFIGTVGGICGYLSHGRNIIRAASSLTGARTKKDPAFESFRQSGNRMKQASPLAAALYSLIPEKQRQYSLYRTLTGKALKMIKQGVHKALIMETLRQVYIEPLLQPQAEQQVPGSEPARRSSFSGRPQPAKRSAKSRHLHGPVPESSSLLLPAGFHDRPGLRKNIRLPPAELVRDAERKRCYSRCFLGAGNERAGPGIFRWGRHRPVLPDLRKELPARSLRPRPPQQVMQNDSTASASVQMMEPNFFIRDLLP
jgi:hypothetical protein